jgi:hypothetical protein
MPEDSLTLSWSDVLKYAWKSIKASWAELVRNTVVIALLSIVLPWGGAYHFSESGWDRVLGGSATWALLAIPVYLVGAGVWHLTRAPLGRARDVLAKQQGRIDALQRELTTARDELDQERAASPVFGEAIVPRHIVGRMIRLADLPPGLWLDKRVLEGCQILGPARVIFAGSKLDDNRFYGTTDYTFVVVPNVAEHFREVIVFCDCRISECEFHNVTVVGTAHQITTLQTGMVEGT